MPRDSAWLLCRSCVASLPESGVALLTISPDSGNGRFSYVNSFGSACPILYCCVLTNVFLFPWQRAANTMPRSHFPRSATRAGGDDGTLSREKPHVKGSPALLCRSSRSVSWSRRAFQGVWRLGSGPGWERQGRPTQKGADGGQVEVRLIQIDHVTRMREIQQGRVGQRRLVLPGDSPLDIVRISVGV